MLVLVSSLPSSNPIIRVESAIQVEVAQHKRTRSRCRSKPWWVRPRSNGGRIGGGGERWWPAGGGGGQVVAGGGSKPKGAGLVVCSAKEGEMIGDQEREKHY